MSGLEPLLEHIYHEKQQPGSMLCAQHALNNFLQGNYLTAPDLSEIGRGLDELEEKYDESNTGATSTNMDDTGFFSVQVLDHALDVWGLNLTRWRSEDMRPYQQHPERQFGFILNLEQHWFTLRRFGDHKANIEQDEGNGHWFNLNSFLKEPEWVSKTYLGMVLQQSEAEGYSVFVVTPRDREAPLALPRTQADMIASTLPEPTSSSRGRISTTRDPIKRSTIDLPDEDAPFEDEDYELQAALQASLMAGGLDEGDSTSLSSMPDPGWGTSSLAPTRTSTAEQPAPSGSALGLNIPGHADLDPVSASMEKNRVLLQRMKEQQEFAQREMWSETDLSPEEQAALEERRARRKKEEEEEEEHFRKAIEESEAAFSRQATTSGTTAADAPSGSASDQRMYDDEDEELQAALRASLEEHQTQPQSTDITAPKQVAADDSMETDDETSTLSESTTLESTTQAAPPSLDEVRKARLARFGM